MEQGGRDFGARRVWECNGEGKGREERNPDPSRCHPEDHARTRCVISDCLPDFVGELYPAAAEIGGGEE